MNTEDELKKFTFREPPPFLREAIVAAARKNAVPARRFRFWQTAAVAAIVLALISLVGSRLDRHWTEALVNSVGPQPAPAYAAEAGPPSSGSALFAPGWNEEGIAFLLSGRPYPELNYPGGGNGS